MALPVLTSVAAVSPNLSGHIHQATPRHPALEPKHGLMKMG